MSVSEFRPGAHNLRLCTFLLFTLLTALTVTAQSPSASTATLGGVVLDDRGAVVAGAKIEARTLDGRTLATTVSTKRGRFQLNVPAQALHLVVIGPYVAANETRVENPAQAGELTLTIRYAIAPLQQTLVITAQDADPAIDHRDDARYRNMLFNRDDQLLQTLDSGINAGQHEGGGTSVEIRRFGFNLDHGGANGGLKVLVDDIPQNQPSQGHGQGYLGSLKSISPELVEGVDIVNGPFQAEYGDFSALGVVHIRQRESLVNEWTLRAQGGSFGAYRTFAAWSPREPRAASFVAWEHSYTDGPFLRPLHYVRDNFTANRTVRLDAGQTLGLRLNTARNDFDSSGQIPLDEVLSGQLDRFGAFPGADDGGHVRSGAGSLYYKQNFGTTATLRADAYLSRSLFDLFSDFTFYLHDPVHGDGIQQHDSRLSDGGSVQYMRSSRVAGHAALLMIGGNIDDNWVRVDLFHAAQRVRIAPTAENPWTLNHVHLNTISAYAQQSIELPHLHLDAGLRWDGFRFRVTDDTLGNPLVRRDDAASPKFNLVYTPLAHWPTRLHFNYGRAYTSLDARSIAQFPNTPLVTATDFYMLGMSHSAARVALSADWFLIDRDHELVYDADDGSNELQGPSRSYGWEVKASAHLRERLTANAGMTQVSNAFFRGTHPRAYVDAAPHTVANASLMLNDWRGWFAALRYRHGSGYWLFNAGSTAVPVAPCTNSMRCWASGFDVVDVAVSKHLYRGLEWNLAIDNLTNKRYYETQNFFDSRTVADINAPANARLVGTPGYSIGVTTGLTLRLH